VRDNKLRPVDARQLVDVMMEGRVFVNARHRPFEQQMVSETLTKVAWLS